jgi:hypothetical protein
MHPVSLARRPPTNPIKGKYYDWPVGYHAGVNLKDYGSLEQHTLGETTYTHFPDGTAHKNRMQEMISCKA